MLREGLMVGSDPRNSQGMSWITDRPPTAKDADIAVALFLTKTWTSSGDKEHVGDA
jgi:hypothetical protein